MSKEYIEREATCRDCIHYPVCKDTVADENWNENTPKEVREMFSPSGCKNYKSTADVVEVRHGEWAWYPDRMDRQELLCTNCEESAHYNEDGERVMTPFCPNCGAKMDGKGEG